LLLQTLLRFSPYSLNNLNTCAGKQLAVFVGVLEFDDSQAAVKGSLAVEVFGVLALNSPAKYLLYFSVTTG